MRLACGICNARSPEFKETRESFTWQCKMCMKKNTYRPPKPKKKPKPIVTQDIELETETNIGEEDAKEEIG